MSSYLFLEYPYLIGHLAISFFSNNNIRNQIRIHFQPFTTPSPLSSAQSVSLKFYTQIIPQSMKETYMSAEKLLFCRSPPHAPIYLYMMTAEGTQHQT